MFRLMVNVITQFALLLQVQAEDDLSQLQNGHLVAFRTELLEDAPWIGKVVGTKKNQITVVWMEGGYNKPLKIAKHQVRGKLIEWTDNVDKCSIILYGFELTKTNRLRKTTVDALKSLYNELCT